MNQICDYNECTGCASCVNVCPKKCISLKDDMYGELHPEIDHKSCVECGLCQKVCPNNVQMEFYFPSKCIASWIEDKKKRKLCASGGIGTILAEYVIAKNGVVFGSRYDNDLSPVMTYSKTEKELEYFKGSRYVQSVVENDTFIKVKEFLREGLLVLFIGTPCQIAGLKCFLKNDYSNLITVDLICHGVCPTSYFKQEIKYLSERIKVNEVSDVRFRGNDGNNFKLTLWNKDGHRIFPRNSFIQKLSYGDESQQYYIKGFLWGITMRENCYNCKYARPERVSDITIGDFIGLGEDVTFEYSPKNVSSVLVNTTKGDSFYQQVSLFSCNLKNVQRQYQERLKYKPSLVHPFKRHYKNKQFRTLYLRYGYVYAIRNVLRKESLRERFCYYKKLPKYILGKIL